MNREILMAAACAVATIALAWVVDHPAKVGGSVITLVAFVIIAAVARFRGDGDRASRWSRGRHRSRPDE